MILDLKLFECVNIDQRNLIEAMYKSTNFYDNIQNMAIYAHNMLHVKLSIHHVSLQALNITFDLEEPN